MITIRKFEAKDVARMAEIWNQVVEDGVAFPQEEGLTGAEAAEFFAAQTVSAVAEDEQGNVKGLYILHPNNIGFQYPCVPSIPETGIRGSGHYSGRLPQ